MITTRRPLVVLATVLAVAMAVQGARAYRTLRDKALAQNQVTASVTEWRQTYQALAEPMKRWQGGYRHIDSVDDQEALLGLATLDRYGLATNPDTAIVNKVETISQNGVPLGLSKSCLVTGGDGGLEVTAANYQALLRGIGELVARQDIHVRAIAFRGGKPQPSASLADFCVLLRIGE